MRKILVTGGGGYIGSIGVSLLLKKGYEVVVIDNFDTGFRQPLELLKKKFGNRQFRFYDLDLTSDISTFFGQETNIKAVIHYAASCNVDESMRNPSKYFYNNVLGTNNLLNLMRRKGIKKIIFSSTCAVYGEAEYVPIDENHPTNPENPYGESKLMCEKIIQWYGQIFGMKYVILRYFNVTGGSFDGTIGDSKKPSSLLIQNLVRGAMGIAPFYLTCPEVSSADKTPIRDYLNVVDLSEAHIVALDYLFSSVKNEIMNLGTGSGNSVLEMVKKVENLTSFKFKLIKNQTRQGEYAKVIASNKKAKDVLGWIPKRDLTDSIESLLKWYEKNPFGWKY